MANTRENFNDIFEKMKLSAAEKVNNSDTLPRFKKMAEKSPIKAFVAALGYEIIRLPHSGK
jgi:hypothetical protein